MSLHLLLPFALYPFKVFPELFFPSSFHKFDFIQRVWDTIFIDDVTHRCVVDPDN